MCSKVLIVIARRRNTGRARETCLGSLIFLGDLARYSELYNDATDEVYTLFACAVFAHLREGVNLRFLAPCSTNPRGTAVEDLRERHQILPASTGALAL